MEEVKKEKTKIRFPIWAKALIVLFLSISLVGVISTVFFSSSIRSITRNFYIDQSVQTADSLGLYLDIDNVKAVKEKVDSIYQSIPDEEKVENSNWDEPEWYAYLEHYDEVMDMPEYKALMEQLKAFHAVNDARYTYIAYADLEHARLVYLVDDSPEEEMCRPGSFDDFTESDMSIYDHLEEGFTPEITNWEEYGYLASVGRPIFDENHKVVAFALVDLSMEKIVEKENQNTRTLIIILASVSAGALLAGFLLVVFLIARPLGKLTEVANEYTAGDNPELNKFEQIMIKTGDEIEALSNSMKKMEGDIKHYITDLLSTTNKLEGAEKKVTEMKTLADRDALTGVYNKRAYFEAEERLNNEMNKGKAKFSITMIDLNDLKVTNDTLGHEKGDALIIKVVEVIKKTFTKSNIYRVGGDEFVILSEGEDYKNIAKLEKEFLEFSKDVSAAIGVAIYDSKTDNNVEDTFKRADRKMYENKKKMKNLQ